MLKSVIGTELTLTAFFICTAVSLVLGIATALVSMFKSRSTQGFAITLAVLPAAVQLVIMLVNGNIGAGVAIAGAFSLVRFRSAPGTAREIVSVFLAMAIGLATGMGYVVTAAVFFAVTAAVIVLLGVCNFGTVSDSERILKITIPENLDYDGLFDSVFAKYLKKCSLEKVKTTGMGTLYELQYSIVLNGDCVKKEFIDELRCLNGNLSIVCCKDVNKEAL